LTKWIAVLPVLLAAASPAQAQTMEAAFDENCPKSVSADEAAVPLYCACVRRQIIETTAFPEDREASFALIGPAGTLAEMTAHAEVVATLPPVLEVIIPLCLMSALTGKVLPDGTIKQ
jgi:hypothetical protein